MAFFYEIDEKEKITYRGSTTEQKYNYKPLRSYFIQPASLANKPHPNPPPALESSLAWT